MAKNEQQRQKKLAKKRSKAILARRELNQTKQQMASLGGQMQAASSGEIYGCYISSGVATGMGTVLLGRRISGGRLAIAFFLLDTYCLGVKDAGGRIGTPGQFDEMLDQIRSNEAMLPAAPSTARKAVEEAIEYARSLGFPPHADYRKVSPIWGDIDASHSDREFAFGRDGKPFYIAGPHDDAQRQNLIRHRLRDSVGEGNFEFTLPIDPLITGDLDDADGDADVADVPPINRAE